MEPPDPEERRIRFGCGALFGLFAAVLFCLRVDLLSWPWWLIPVIVISLSCGYAARKLGDDFWWDEARKWW
jgi:hypothetical protein